MNYYDYIREYLEKKPSLQCVPLKGKTPFLDGWQSIEVTDEVIDSWEENIPGITGFGLRAGQSNIGWMDIDTDDQMQIHKIDEVMDLASVCVKRGLKGRTVFFRFEGIPKKSKYNIYLRKGDKKPIVEFNFTSGQTVLPPSIHPDTKLPYKWISESLLDIDIEDLPIIDEDKIEFLETILRAPSLEEGLKNVPTGITGEGSGKFITMTKQCARLLHLGVDENTIARTLVGLDRQLFPGNQFFLSPKIGKSKVSPTDDVSNAIVWVTDYKANLLKQDADLRSTLASISSAKEAVPSFDDWRDPKPLIKKEKLLEFPEDLFPDAFKKYCFDLSAMSGLPPEAYLSGLFTSFSACTQGKVIIRAKHDFSIRPSISSLIVAPSGSRKDSIFDWSLAPLKKLMNQDKTNYKSNFVEKEHITIDRLKENDKKRKKAISEGDQTMIDQLTEERTHLQNELVTIKKTNANFIFESGSQERLYKLMEENQDRGIFVCSSEFVGMMGVMGKKGNEAMRGFLMKLFNGSVHESFTHQTIGGINVDLDKVFGCSLSSIQNDVIAGILNNITAGKDNDGYIQRYFLIPIQPKVRRMSDEDITIDSFRVDNIFALYYNMEDKIDVTWESSEVRKAYIDYDVMLQERIIYDVSAIKSFRSKYSGQSVKLAWIFEALDAPIGKIPTKISKKSFLKAVKWLEWQSNVLDVTLSNVNWDIAYRLAVDLLPKMMSYGGGDIGKFCNHYGFKRKEIDPGLNLLLETDNIRIIKQSFEVNPKA